MNMNYLEQFIKDFNAERKTVRSKPKQKSYTVIKVCAKCKKSLLVKSWKFCNRPSCKKK